MHSPSPSRKENAEHALTHLLHGLSVGTEEGSSVVQSARGLLRVPGRGERRISLPGRLGRGSPRGVLRRKDRFERLQESACLPRPPRGPRARPARPSRRRARAPTLDGAVSENAAVSGPLRDLGAAVRHRPDFIHLASTSVRSRQSALSPVRSRRRSGSRRRVGSRRRISPICFSPRARSASRCGPPKSRVPSRGPP